MAANSLMWCGGIQDVGWLGPLLSPCTFEGGASALLLMTTLVSVLVQGGRLGLIHQFKLQGRLRRGVSGLSGAFIACCLFMAGTHLLHFSVGLALLRAFPFHVTYHACLALTWGTMLGFALYTCRVAATIDFRFVTGPAVLVYCISLYSFYHLYFDPHNFPMSYIKASIWTAMLQTAMAAVTTWLGIKRAAKNPSLESMQAQLGYGYASLPGDEAAASRTGGGTSSKPGGSSGGAGTSAGAAGGTGGDGGEGETDGRTWISLFGDACSYVWPTELHLQLRAIACLLLLVAMRFINLAVPILYKRVVDTLAAASAKHPAAAAGEPPRGLGLDLGLARLVTAWLRGGGDPADPSAVHFGALVWPWVILYLAAVFFQGGAGGGIVGFINNMRSYLWIPVSQDAYRRISLRVFDHVMDLDLTFHLRKKTGEVTKVVDRGTNAMQNILSTILFNVLPQIFDVLAAATYLAQALEPTIAIIVFIAVGSYIPLTIIITEWRGKLRREMNATDQVKSARATDALLNYETVKYFTNERYESVEYAKAIDAYQDAEFRSMSSINVLNVTQSAIMFCGIASGLLVCAAGVADHSLTVGDAVLFLSLMAQLYGPLNFFGSYYRTIQQYMIDMENLLELLGREPVVADTTTARDLVVATGELAFDDVSFQYEAGQTVLRNVSFRVPGGQTIAFVGATGSGKSTITRLIFRFYDVSSGAVRVDGQDVRNVSQVSLRRAIGMVPQDTVLFNDTIMHNIRYGNLAATDEQVQEAARLACIHDTIVNRFPKGYNTVVGERGLRLSGGEKQRVAFARALLKNPAMLVLDEATSALDTITEKKIQGALAELRSNRTTVIVAHRLSTIADADIIVVMATGQVVEQGSHTELLARGGLYAEMWNRQAQTAQGEGLDPASDGTSSKSGSALDLKKLGDDKEGGGGLSSSGSAAAGRHVLPSPPVSSNVPDSSASSSNSNSSLAAAAKASGSAGANGAKAAAAGAAAAGSSCKSSASAVSGSSSSGPATSASPALSAAAAPASTVPAPAVAGLPTDTASGAAVTVAGAAATPRAEAAAVETADAGGKVDGAAIGGAAAVAAVKGKKGKKK
ncbi:hypothetical protein HYH02_006700 [Chlamydomonas schloesseri]|uniref:Uncharacterized protein n=1 Tax=Chlamydomonas schloesseri TaxID=2026947 RepID=A0A836B5G7_9CHLO|nr:hypothetical protein HYH02_006700 [Chlamydomonas schloesseri]|eukprot:KAG2448115.1 hypothetical protein HYH02_006700 [Chlamydomonas schloesseri]